MRSSRSAVNTAARITHLKLHLRGGTVARNHDRPALSDGIESILHQVEYGPTERAGVKWHLSKAL